MDERVEQIWQTLENTYQKKPKLVLSVVGDSDTFVPKVWSRDVFQTALIEAAKYSGGDTWILFRGNRKSSVSLIIAEAFETYSHLQNLHSYPTEADYFPIKPISLSLTGEPNKYKKLKKLTGHLNLMIGESQENFEKVRLKLETHIHQKRVSFLDEAELKLDLSIPVVRILVEGDLNSIDHVSESIHKGLPVVIVKGSGKAANLIVDYIERPHSLKSNAALLFGIQFRNNTFKTLRKSLRKIKSCEHLINIFDVENTSPGSFLQVIGEAVVRASAYAHFTDEGEGEDTESSTFAEPIAIVNENNDIGQLRKKQFRKCLSTSDYIKQSDAMPASVPLFFYFGYQYLQHKGKLLDYGYLLLYQALKTNRCDYVNALVSDGVKFKATYLSKLYFKTFPVMTTTYCCGQKRKDLVNLRITSDYILCVSEEMEFQRLEQQTNTGREDIPLEKQKLDHFRKVSWAVRSLCCYLLKYNAENEKEDEKGTPRSRPDAERNTHESTETQGPSTADVDPPNGGSNSQTRTDADVPGPSQIADSTQDEILPERRPGARRMKTKYSQDEINKAVLLWAIFAKRIEIAEVFWLHGNNHLVTSLICAVLLRKLSEKAEDCEEHNLSRHFEEHARLFEEKVQLLLDLMYQENERCAMAAMDEESIVFGVKTTPLIFAYENLLYDVIAHPCSQRHMDRVWHSKMTNDDIGRAEENGNNSCDSGCIKPCCCKPDTCQFKCTPKVWYIINYAVFLFVLLLYSGFVLTSVSHSNYIRGAVRIMELAVYVWGVGDLFEEYRPLMVFFVDFIRDKKCRRFLFQTKLHLNNFWNFMDLLSYISIIVALAVRHAGDQQDFTWSRRIFSFSLLIMYLRFLQAFLMTRTFGATLIMIKEMLKDLLAFIWLAIFVILGVGIYYHANLWPDHDYIFGDGSIQTWRIWRIISLPYFQLYGEPNKDYLSGKDLSDCEAGSSGPGEERCPQEDWTIMVIAAVFMLFSNLLLVNLVIAKFSYTFAKVKGNSEKLWMFERYVIIKDFKQRKPSPLNIIIRFINFVIYLKNKKKNNRTENNHGSTPESAEAMKKRSEFLIKFQKVMAKRVINRQRKSEK